MNNIIDLEKLREARGGRTLAEVGKAIGVTRSQMSAYEHGKNLPSVERLVALLRVYEIKLEDILLETENAEANHA